MRKILAVGLLAALGIAAAGSAVAQTTVRVGWCARTVSSAAAPFAIATKMGWYAEAGIKVELVPLPGSTDCVKSVATRDIPYSLPSIEPVAIIRPQGVKMKNYYTAYQGNIYGIAVPDESPIKTFTDLKGKRIGVTSMASAGVIIARALAAMNGMDPDRDISIVVAGEAAQTAALLRSGQVDALSQFDTQYALTENAGAKLRMLDASAIERFPSNGLVALEETLANKRAEAVALAQGYAKGTMFAIANPEAAIRILWEVFPQTKATGKDEATALRDDIKTLEARAVHWKLEAGGVTKWGENSPKNYAAYLDFLVKNNDRQGQGRRQRPHHQRPDRRHQQVRRERDRGDGEGVQDEVRVGGVFLSPWAGGEGGRAGGGAGPAPLRAPRRAGPPQGGGQQWLPQVFRIPKTNGLPCLLSPPTRPGPAEGVGMLIGGRGSVHSSTSRSPAGSFLSALRALSAGRGHLSPRRLRTVSAMAPL